MTNVILVGHSYGGMVIAGVADIVPHRLRHLVYLDAAAPVDGQSLLDCVRPETAALLRRLVVENEDARPITLLPEWTFGLPEGPELKWVKEKLRPQPAATFEQKVHFRNPIALALPKTFIWCSGSTPSQKRDVREDWPTLPSSFPTGWNFYEMKTGHDAMLTAPIELARVLDTLAGQADPS